MIIALYVIPNNFNSKMLLSLSETKAARAYSSRGLADPNAKFTRRAWKKQLVPSPSRESKVHTARHPNELARHRYEN